MPAKRTTMRQVREIVRLHQAGVSPREIGTWVDPREVEGNAKLIQAVSALPDRNGGILVMRVNRYRAVFDSSNLVA